MEQRAVDKEQSHQEAVRREKAAQEEIMGNHRREAAYAESRRARVKKVERTRGKKVRSWQVLNR